MTRGDGERGKLMQVTSQYIKIFMVHMHLICSWILLQQNLLDYPKLKEQEKFKLYKLGKESAVIFIPNILIGQHLLHNFYKSSTVVESTDNTWLSWESLNICIYQCISFN